MKKNNKQKNKTRKKLRTNKSVPLSLTQQETPRIQSTFPLAKKILIHGWKIFSGFAVVIGLVITFYPKIDVSIESSPNSNNIFSIPFTISNDGLLYIKNIDVWASPVELKAKNKRVIIKGAAGFGTRYKKANSMLPVLKAGDKYTVIIPFPPDFDNIVSEYTDIGLIVQFMPPLIPFQMERVFRFRASRTTDGVLIWHRQPESGSTNIQLK